MRRAFGCLLICAGTAGAGAVGSHDDHVYTVDYLEELLVAPRILVYFGVFVIWYLVNICFLQKRPRGHPIRGISLGMTAGTIAGNMFCVKAAVEIIQYSINENTPEPWTHWLPYVVLLGAVFFAVSNVRYMTQGLQEFEALFMVTVYEGSMIVSGCVSGAIVLLDLRSLEAWRIALYWTSVLLIVSGMTVVFSNEMKNKSSLAAGTASIEPKMMKELASNPQIVLNVAGVGSAGLSTEGVPSSPAAAMSRSSPKNGSAPALGDSPFFTTPVKDANGHISRENSSSSNGLKASTVGKSPVHDEDGTEDPSTPLAQAGQV